jgi:hypothetical protein
VKGAGPQREINPPGNWIAPPGSNRSGGGGNKAAGASGVEGRIRRLGESAVVTRVNAEQATKLIMQEPTQLLSGEGRRRWSRYERIGSIGPAGVVATACRHRGPDATREAPAVMAVGINWQLARARPGRLGDGEARSTDETG